MADKPTSSPENILNNVWSKRAGGIEVDNIDWSRPITAKDLEYLYDRYPFLQLLSIDPNFEAGVEPKFITLSSNWVAHDYGDALTSSPGEFLYGGYADENEEDGVEGGSANPGKGTIVKQAVDTAAEMVSIAIEKGWPGIDIIDGHELMKWAAWNEAQNHEIVVNGYEPDETAHKRRERVKHLQKTVPGQTPKPGQ